MSSTLPTLILAAALTAQHPSGAPVRPHPCRPRKWLGSKPAISRTSAR